MSVEDGDDDGVRPPQFRYFIVFGLTLVSVVFLIATPSADWSRALAVGIAGLALVVSVATSRARETVRRRRASVLGTAIIAVVLLIAVGAFPSWLVAVIALFVTAGVPVALARGLLRLLGQDGVTLQSVAGSLAIYLSVGLLFAWAIGFVAQVENGPYFAQHTSGTQGEKVYFSFATLTTTGYGDFSPATPAGQAIAVIEMLTGQLYLVTVIGLLIGNFAARRRVP